MEKSLQTSASGDIKMKTQFIQQVLEYSMYAKDW